MSLERPRRFSWNRLTGWLRESSSGRQLLAGYLLGVGSFLSLLAVLRHRRRTVRKPERRSDRPVSAAHFRESPEQMPKLEQVRDIYPTRVSPLEQLGRDGPIVGADPASVKQGFESLSTNTRALTIFAVAFTVLFGGILFGVWMLLHVYMGDEQPEEVAASAAPVLVREIPTPLEPMLHHDNLDWQDMVHQRQRSDAQLRRMGWTIDPTTGQAVIPPVPVPAKVASSAGDPLRFPPPYAPVRAGPYEDATEAIVLPPVGDAATADQMRPSIYQPPTGMPDVKSLPNQSGSMDRQNNPTR